MSEGESEYEVESIQRAKVVKERGKKSWSYYVKWKNYDQADNTWEPPTSFSNGSEHFITRFWERINLGDRDWQDLSQFKPDEEFFPLGPPRGRPRRKTPKANAKQPLPPPPQSDSETEVRSLIGDDVSDSHATPATQVSGTKRKRGQNPEVQLDQNMLGPPRAQKNSRRRSAPEIALASDKSHSPERSSGPSKRQSISATGASLRSPVRNSKKRSKIALPKDSSPDEILLRPDVTEQDIEMRAEATTEHPSPSGSPKKSVSGVGGVYVHEPATREPMAEDASAPFGTPTLLIPNASSAQPSPALPSHRARKANPKVKMFDDPLLNVDEGSSSAIPTKAKFMRPSATVSTPRIVAEPSNMASRSGRTLKPTEKSSSHRPAPRVSGSKAGPGRSSRGLHIQGSTSLLTSQKGALRTVKSSSGKKASRDVDDGSGDETELTLGDGTVFEYGERMIAMSLPVQPPTAEELLKLGGLVTSEAEALPDFDDEADAHGESDPDIRHHGAVLRSNLVISGSEIGEEQLASDELKTASDEKEVSEEKEVELEVAVNRDGVEGLHAMDRPATETAAVEDKSTGSAANSHFAAWRNSSIFGPLGIGRYVPAASTTEPTTTSSRSILFLSLDSSVSLPVVIKDICLPGALVDLLGDSPGPGPPGKFYKGDNALTMLDAFKPSDFSARLSLESDVNETHKLHFDRFRTRLRSGELFVQMIGAKILAMCSSENEILGEKLHMPANLLGLEDNVLVAKVSIQDSSAYANAVILADDIRWSA